MQRNNTIVLGLVLFPLFITVLAMAGFALDVPVSGFHALLAYTMSMAAVCSCEKGNRRFAAIAFTSTLVLSVIVSGIFFTYTCPDASGYHRPAAMMLVEGWNPLRTTEVEQLKSTFGIGFRPWHVAFLPHLGWIYCAAMQKVVGFYEVSESLNLILLVAAGGMLWPKFRWWTLGMLAAPVVAENIFNGAFDISSFALFIISVMAALRVMDGDRSSHLILLAASVVSSGLKYTGVVHGALIYFVLCCCLAIKSYGMKKRILAAEVVRCVLLGACAAVLMLLSNAAPYLTSIKNHGGPFYPSHSFVASERFTDDKNPITYDFAWMNDDARTMGFAGRFAWAYCSQSAVEKFHEMYYGEQDFKPEFFIPADGFGLTFRIIFVVSLLGLFFVRDRVVLLSALIITASVLLVPGLFTGYARYVPQLYLLPWLVAYEISLRIQALRLRHYLKTGLLVLLLPIIPVKSALNSIAIACMTTVQSLALQDVMERNPDFDMSATTVTPFMFFKIPRDRWRIDNGDQLEGYHEYGKLHMQINIPELPPEVWRYDVHPGEKTLVVFAKRFLPNELMKVHRRIWSLLKYRLVSI